MKKLSTLILIFLTIISCKDDDNTVGTDTDTIGTVNFEFKNNVGNDLIDLNTGSYTNQSNETYTISELKYIVSNIVLIKDNGDEFTYPVADSYFLINEEVAESKKVNLVDIPSGTFTKIKFGIGVDQSKYPLNGVNNFIPTAEESEMLWSWSAGYKFIKFEGAFTPSGGTMADFILHIGSHGTTLDNYKEVLLDLPGELTIGDGTTSNVAITADVAKIFDSTNTHSLEVKSDIQVDPENAPKLAENVSTMFSVATVSN
ncbi:MbnP family protein [Aquimarina sp. RZ0]|uniref:MbnP family protein n=1 Tax=Aquimarina sp. RZ0 TaxID=2607730 RepID=UPI0011F25E46|nr:MbnP family protein [Aquimarina sp. RZ0]KAA1247283.1 hypothetical protein F0000_03815 [Aquimarina sp. RZ0]